ncbi:MAG: trehalase family glycosidase [bacterium]|nr:trehalase family glycosidase [bacterium]
MNQQWDTSSAAGMNIVTHITTGLQVTFVTLNVESGKVTTRFGFDVGQPLLNPPLHLKHRNIGVGTVARTGSHGPCLDCAVVDVMVNKRTYTLSMADHNGVLLWKAVPGKPCQRPTMSFIVFSLPGSSGIQFKQAENGVILTCAKWTGTICLDFALKDYGTFTSLDNMVRYLSKSRRLNFSFASKGILALRLPDDDPGAVTVAIGRSERETSRESSLIMSRFETVREELQNEYENRRIGGFPEMIEDSARAITDCVYWNTCRSEIAANSLTLVSREWVQMMEDVYDLSRGSSRNLLIFNWDSAFHGLLACWECPDLAERNLLAALEGQDSEGRVPQVRIGSLVSDRSNPPILALAAWKLYRCTANKTFLENVFPRLYHWYGWFERNRRGPGDILWSWGTDKEIKDIEPGMRLPGMAGARYESGMDDNPMWDFLPYDPATRRMTAACVDFSAFMIIFSRVLAVMAQELGLEQETTYFREQYAKEASICESWLWDERYSFYFPRFPDGRWVHMPSVAGFYPLLAGTPSRTRAARLISENFYNNDRFGGMFALPTVARCVTEYDPDGDYWRGRIWPPANYLTFLGLRNYDQEAAHHLAVASAEIFLREWRGQGHVHENYSSLTGYGECQDGVYARSCPYYTWGGLMGLMVLEEILDVELFGQGLRFGSVLWDQPVEVNNMLYRGQLHGVVTSPAETVLHRSGKTLFRAKPGCQVRSFIQDAGSITFRIVNGTPSQITLTVPVRPERCNVAVGNKPVSVVLVSDCEIAFNIGQDNGPVSITW